EGLFDLYRKPSNGARDEELVLKSGESKLPASWSLDGRFLIFASLNAKTATDLWLLPDPLGTSAERHPIPWLRTEFDEGLASFSPDMRWIAYRSGEAGRPHIYVRSFTPPQPTGSSPANRSIEGKWQVSKDGAARVQPRWRADGKELFFEHILSTNR